MIAWISLFLASFFEVFWASSLKYLHFGKIRIFWKRYGIKKMKFWLTLVPLVSYIVFGIGNVSLFSFASKSIALTIAYSVWMGLALVVQTLVDIFWMKEKLVSKQLFFIFIVLVGVVGLKYYS